MNRDVKTEETRPARRPRKQSALSQKRSAREPARDLESAPRAGALEDGLLAVGQALEEQLRARPYATLAAVAGAGFILGNALHTRIGRMALLAAGGFAATRFLQGDGAMLLERLLGSDVDDEDIKDDLGDDADLDAAH